MTSNPLETMQGIAEQVRSTRDQHGWTQAELADQAGLSRPTIARIERGDDVSTATLAKVMGCLELTLTVTHEREAPPAHPQQT